jgi:uncharacterized protein YdeI (YjbR/CyaY-like superfamily)
MKTDSRVDDYLAQAAPFARPILAHLRSLVHRAEPAAEETLKWRAPMFLCEGKILCGIVAFKAHCAFILWHHEVSERVAREGRSSGPSRGQFGRITARSDLPSDAILMGYIRQTAKLIRAGVSARPPRKSQPKRPPPVPPDLAAALRKNGPAAATFQELSPSGRREYLEWIAEAKRPETRAKRLATTLEWLAAGKARNWQYEKC